MGRVSRPVKVFCWLGWNEQSRWTPFGAATSARCPNLGRGRTLMYVTANDAAPYPIYRLRHLFASNLFHP